MHLLLHQMITFFHLNQFIFLLAVGTVQCKQGLQVVYHWLLEVLEIIMDYHWPLEELEIIMLVVQVVGAA